MNIFIAILTLFIGHTFRMLRTMYILNPYVHRPAMSYWISLGSSYIAEFLVPFRISDFIRTLTFSKLSSSPWQISIAAAILERSIDFLGLVIIFHLVSLNFTPLLIVAITLIITMLLLPCLFNKKLYIKIVSLFNNKIKTFLLGVYWALFRITKDLSFYSAFILLCLSIGAWGCYIVSIYFLTQTISTLKTIVELQFHAFTNINIWNIFTYFPSKESIIYSIYILLPSLLTIGLGYYFKSSNHQKQLNIIPFLSEQDSLEFFIFFFRNAYLKDNETYYQLTHSTNIIKDLSAASEAKTFLVEKDNMLFIRKIALGKDAATKLRQQFEWIQSNKHLSVPKIYNFNENQDLFTYNMEYFANGESFFTMIHILSLENSFNILESILNSIKDSYISQDGNISHYTQNYFDTKVLQNRKTILDSLSSFSQYPYLIVNNQKVPNVLHTDTIASMQAYNDTLGYPIYQIHGDLTIENILVNTNKEYMIIDPAPSYINSFAEYAKLFQSLHAKYEHVKKINTFTIDRNNINYAQYATIQYEELFNKLKELIIQQYGTKGLKATYFYEAICHIRTASYMIKLQKEHKAILMLALAGNALKKWQETEEK